MRRIIFGGLLGLLSAVATVESAFGWGDDGHKAIALIAQNYLDPALNAKVRALLAADTDHLTAHDIASAATWADRYRDSDRNTTKERYNRTHLWHFVDIEVRAPSLDAACFGHPPLPPGAPASMGPPNNCVVDKINQFIAELTNPATPARERIIALKFLLHFVGDLHQPLHSADDRDEGGNQKNVSAVGFTAGKLHHFWDTEFVDELGNNPRQIANSLIPTITPGHRHAWSQGIASDWAQEAFAIAQADAYGQLPPPNQHGSYRLSANYVEMARQDVALQLSRAGVRLAAVLNSALR